MAHICVPNYLGELEGKLLEFRSSSLQCAVTISMHSVLPGVADQQAAGGEVNQPSTGNS